MAKPTPSWKEVVMKRWRLWLRAIHRDVGYLAVGLTFVYALSGIAINHVGDWDADFKSVVDKHQLDIPLPDDELELTTLVVEKLGIPLDDDQVSYFASEILFEVSLEKSLVVLDTSTGVMTVASKEPRFFLRVANWLHRSRGKSAWTYIADGYAILLLYLAISGTLLLKGRKGLLGRGGILIVMGAAIPIAYLQFVSAP